MAKYTLQEWQNKLERFAAKNEKIVKKHLGRGLQVVRKEVVVEHLSGPKMPSGVGDTTNATLARQTGDLATSINTKTSVRRNKIRGSIVTNVPYAKKHELGQGVPKRPFMAPSVEAKREEVTQMILDGIMREYERTR